MVYFTYNQKFIKNMRMCDLNQLIEKGVVFGVGKVSWVVAHFFQQAGFKNNSRMYKYISEMHSSFYPAVPGWSFILILKGLSWVFKHTPTA